MRRFLRFFTALTLCLTLAVPTVVAQRQGNQRNERPSRPGNNGNNNGGNRPGANNGNHNNGNNNGGNRPGANNGNHNNGNNNGGNRPGNNNGGNRPGMNNGNHNNGFRPNQPGHNSNYPSFGRPTQPGHFTPPPAPPVRPYRPTRPGWSAWHRPTPPSSWRPVVGVPSIGSILGMAFGTVLSNSIDFLTSAGYTIDGYQNGVVYLRNVPQLNFYWPDAMLYYDNGRLAGSEYIYSSNYYDQARYNTAYNSLVYNYGQPVSVTYPSAGNVLSTWFVPGGSFITLQFGPNTLGGQRRYYTTLQVGRY